MEPPDDQPSGPTRNPSCQGLGRSGQRAAHRRRRSHRALPFAVRRRRRRTRHPAGDGPYKTSTNRPNSVSQGPLNPGGLVENTELRRDEFCQCLVDTVIALP